MVIKVLMEDTAVSKEFETEHGLSLLIETKNKKILFDTGASDLFLKNLKLLGNKIDDIDLAVISHGHYDHGGGLKHFLKDKRRTNVYIHKLAFEEYYGLRSNNNIEYVGIDSALKTNNRIVFTSDRFFVGEGLQLFSNIDEVEPRPVLNNALLQKAGDDFVKDEFGHEQYLIIEEDGQTVLVTGCTHRGIINVMTHLKAVKGKYPDYVIGGFHLSNRAQTNTESDTTIERTAKFMQSTGAMFYTCHCTGHKPFEKIKSIVGDKVRYIAAGESFTI